MDENNNVASGGSIRAKGVCLPLSIEWLNVEDIDCFKLLGIRFSVDDELLGTSMNLEASKQEVQELNRRGQLLLMPLFASSYFLSAIVLVKIRGVCAHRRLGAVEIQIMKESHPSKDELGQSADMVGSWPLEPAAAAQVNRGEVVRNKTALDLLHNIRVTALSSCHQYILKLDSSEFISRGFFTTCHKVITSSSMPVAQNSILNRYSRKQRKK
jgi:hypothetical protein